MVRKAEGPLAVSVVILPDFKDILMKKLKLLEGEKVTNIDFTTLRLMSSKGMGNMEVDEIELEPIPIGEDDTLTDEEEMIKIVDRNEELSFEGLLYGHNPNMFNRPTAFGRLGNRLMPGFAMHNRPPLLSSIPEESSKHEIDVATSTIMSEAQEAMHSITNPSRPRSS